MDLKQLRALVTVVETGNVTRAAELLHVVQPAISRQLRLLEEDVGTPLFLRNRYGMEPTEAGRTLASYARRVLTDIDRARAEIRPTEGEIGGIVTVGLLPSTADLLSSALVKVVGKKYPGILLRIAIGNAGNLKEWLEAGEVDMALIYESKQTPAIRTTPLVEERLWLVGLPSERLSARRPVPLSRLAGRPLILPIAPHGLRSLVDQAAAEIKMPLTIVAETNAMSVQRHLVLMGHGLTILPVIGVADDLANKRFSAAPLSQPAIERKVVLATSAVRKMSAPLRYVLGELSLSIKASVQGGQWTAAEWLGE